MKQSLLITIAFLALSIFSCKKYPEGPGLSLRSRTERVANTWKMEKVTLNNVDITNGFTTFNYTETYDKNGNYSYNSTLDSGDGKWDFQADESEIRRSGVSGQSSEDLIILKLKENEFWYRIDDGNDVYEFHLVPVE